MKRALVAIALAALGSAARAESSRWGSFDIGVGSYRPDVDSEFSASPGPYEQVFGGRPGWMFRLGVSRALFVTNAGSLEVGLQTGYFQDTGRGQFQDGSGDSGDETKFKIIPVSAVLTYRLDWLTELGIPLAPYGRAALERYHWWVTDGEGDSVEDGATNGWSVAGGLALLLDFFDRDLAREMDRDTGVNHTYLFFEAKKSWIDDFGSSKSWDLSEEDVSLTGGLLFVF